jgi:small-conductance mechanosensitive channel
MDFLNNVYLGNSVKTWLIALGVAVAIYTVLRVLKAVFHRRIKTVAAKTATDVDDLIAELIRRIKFFFLFPVSLYLGSKVLSLSDKAVHILGQLVTIAVIFQGVIWGSVIFDYAMTRVRAGKGEIDPGDKTKLAALGFVFRIVLWSVALLLALDNVGVKVTALVAGLGVGGIAVALALQSILGDLFASLSIVLDKPFVIGDFIVVDDLRGTVEHIGLKTTRVRSLGGEQLVFANSNLLNSRIRNYKRMEKRRIAFTIGVTYQTPAEKLEKIPAIIREIVEAQAQCRFDRSHFASYGDFSLNFDTVYYVTVPDYVVYMDIQQAINLALFSRFEKEGIEFAYPTQTIFVEGSGGAPPPAARPT